MKKRTVLLLAGLAILVFSAVSLLKDTQKEVEFAQERATIQMKVESSKKDKPKNLKLQVNYPDYRELIGKVLELASDIQTLEKLLKKQSKDFNDNYFIKLFFDDDYGADYKGVVPIVSSGSSYGNELLNTHLNTLQEDIQRIRTGFSKHGFVLNDIARVILSLRGYESARTILKAYSEELQNLLSKIQGVLKEIDRSNYSSENLDECRNKLSIAEAQVIDKVAQIKRLDNWLGNAINMCEDFYYETLRGLDSKSQDYTALRNFRENTNQE